MRNGNLLKCRVKIHSLSKQFCTRILFSYNDSWCQLWLDWKNLLRRIPFSKNEDRVDPVYKVNGLYNKDCLCIFFWKQKRKNTPSVYFNSWFIIRNSYQQAYVDMGMHVYSRSRYQTIMIWKLFMIHTLLSIIQLFLHGLT